MATIGNRTRKASVHAGRRKDTYHVVEIGTHQPEVTSDDTKNDEQLEALESFMSDAVTSVKSATELSWESNASGIKSSIVESAVESIESIYKGMRYVMRAALVQRIGIEPTMYSIATVASNDKKRLLNIMDTYIDADLSMMNAIYNMDCNGTGTGSSMAFGLVYDTESDDVIDSRVFATGGYMLGAKTNRRYLIDFTQPSAYATQEGDIIGMESLSFRLDDTSRAESVVSDFIGEAADRPTVITCAEVSDKFGGLMGIDKVVTIDSDGHSVIQEYNGMLPFNGEPNFVC